MSLVFSILIGLLVLVGLVSTFLTIKQWHWAQMLLMLGVYLAGVGVLILGAEVYRIHKLLRMNLPKVEAQVDELEQQNRALESGTRVSETVNAVVAKMREPEAVADQLAGEEGQEPIVGHLKRLAANERDMEQLNRLLDKFAEAGSLPSLDSWDQQNQTLARQRGRVWRRARKVGGPDNNGVIQVAVPEPRPHGIGENAVVYVFEMGEPNAADPSRGAQYLGEFRVVGAAPDGVTLDLIEPLDSRTRDRLARIPETRPLSIYETMPADSHELFTEYDAAERKWKPLAEERLRRLLPAATVEEYLRQGGPVTRDDDEFHRQAFDEEDLPIGPGSEKTPAYELYDRPLRAYGLIFSKLAAQKAQLFAQLTAIGEDIKKLTTTIEQARKLQAERREEKRLLTDDLQHMERDLAVVRDLSQEIAQRLAATKDLLVQGLRANAQLAAELTRRQLALLGESE